MASELTIEGPDGDGDVWLRSPMGTSGWEMLRIGSKDDAVELFSQWLASIDQDEAGSRRPLPPRSTVAVFDPD